LLIFPISTQLTDFLSFAAVDLPRRVEKSVYFATQYIYKSAITSDELKTYMLYLVTGKAAFS